MEFSCYGTTNRGEADDYRTSGDILLSSAGGKVSPALGGSALPAVGGPLFPPQLHATLRNQASKQASVTAQRNPRLARSHEVTLLLKVGRER